MNILTNGDSFTYGDELVNLASAWPYVLANKINASVVNLGEPGSSNDSIIRRTLDYLINPDNIKPDVVIIGWSSAGRSEIADESGVWDTWPGSMEIPHYSVAWRSTLSEYISKYHSPEYYNKKYFQQVLLFQTFLKSQNIKYLMLNTRYRDYYRKVNFNEIEWYNSAIDKSLFIEFDSGGMVDWADKCPKGDRGHFLEDGHQIVSEKIYEHIRNLGWLS